jgi:hypothetical protein
MTEAANQDNQASLIKIERLLQSDRLLSGSHDKVHICITDNYRYSSNDQLHTATRASLASLIEQTQAEGFLLPRDNKTFSLIPVRSPLGSVMERASSCLALSDALSAVPASELQLLFTHGVLGIKTSDGTVSGPAAHVVLKYKGSGQFPTPLSTDQLSFAALQHASRLPVAEPMTVASRLYCFNSYPGFKSQELQDATLQVQRLAESSWEGIFKPRTPSPSNPGWYLFDALRRDNPKRSTRHGAKVYISPTVADVSRCLSRLVEILPSVDFETWKVGRKSYGITRSDKICVYFSSLAQAQKAAQVFVRELAGIEAQGVPFTQQQDSTGLVSIGIDPSQSASLPKFAIQSSWRLWVSRKMGAAIALAKSSPDYPLSPVQAGLWAVHLLGIDPDGWAIRDSNFGRN